MVTLIDISEIALSIAMVVYYHDKERFIFDYVEEDEEQAKFTEGLLHSFRDKAFSIRHNYDDSSSEGNRIVIIETFINSSLVRYGKK